MLSVAEAVRLVTSPLSPIASEIVGLENALGRVLAEGVAARRSQPPVDVSAMDGYAIRAVDVPTVPAALRVIGESAAGGAFPGEVGSGQAVRISTGAAVPRGADAIIIQEHTRRDGERLIVLEEPVRGRWIRAAGLDFRTGQELLQAGRALSARAVGLAAAMNVAWLRVRRRPRIAILATGNELAWPGEVLAPDRIANANGFALAGYVRAMGGAPINLGIASDNEEALAAALAAARGADLLVTIGGVSVGDHDLVGSVLTRLGFQLAFHKVAMRPGKPMMFGTWGEMPVLGLPGNPVSAGVSAVVFLKPAMDILLGVTVQHQPEPRARLGCDISANDERQDYLRARLNRDGDGQWVATPFPVQDSSMFALFVETDCLVVRPPHAPAATAGSVVPIVLFPAAAVAF
jgi:molybdopterin molybdotransferase